MYVITQMYMYAHYLLFSMHLLFEEKRKESVEVQKINKQKTKTNWKVVNTLCAFIIFLH